MKKNIIALLLTFTIFLGLACDSAPEVTIETYKVQQGDFLLSVTESGELEAVNSQTISAPMIPWNLGGLKIVRLAADGQQVQEGDVIVEFDKTEVQKNLDDAKAALEIALAEVRKAKATQASAMEELQSNYEKSKLQHRIKELELEKAGYEADIRKKEIQLELEKAAIALEKAKQEIENKKKVHREELSKLQLKVQQERSKVEDAEETLAKLTVKAPSPGIAILKKNWNTDNKIQVDEEVWRGQPLIGLPDLSALQALIQVNEVDISKIDTMQQAHIRLDAFPDTSFSAQVTDVAVLARNKEKDSKVKVFDITVRLSEKDSTLMPGMTVSCEIIVDRINDALYIPLDALFKRDGETIVYLKKGNDFVPQKVETGAENDDYVVITSGLGKDAEIALLDPTAETLALAAPEE